MASMYMVECYRGAFRPGVSMRFHLHALVLLTIDLALISLATVFALILRDNFDISLARFREIAPYLAMTLAAAAVILPLAGTHSSIWRFSSLNDYLRVAAASAAIVVAAVAGTFVLQRLDGVARAVPVIQGLLMVSFLIGTRVASRYRHTRRHLPAAIAPTSGGPDEETLLLVGINSMTELFLRSVAEFAPAQLKIAGILARNERQRGRHLYQYPILGTPEDVERVLAELEVHGVFVRRIVVMLHFSNLSVEARQALLRIESNSPIKLEFLSERLGFASCDQSEPRPIAPAATLPFSAAAHETQTRRRYFSAKRLVDFLVATVLVVALLPLELTVALLVAVDVGFPVLFWQQRPGMRGRPFKLYKFRTMKAAHDTFGGKIPDAARVSAIGRFLRRTRLDELPQLYNILIGDMSFVGPRPLLPDDQHPDFSARLLIRPGLTGWAQVAGGRSISKRDKAAMDVWYVRNASLKTDFRVLARTIPMIIFGERPNLNVLRQAWQELDALQDPQVQPETAER